MASKISDSKYNLLSEPEDDLMCLICLEVAEEPWQHGECGRLFCKKCLDGLGRDQACPNCRKKRPQYFQDSRSKRAIQALSVMCTENCGWVGTVGTLEKHVAACELTLLPCPKECQDQLFMRKDLERHLEKDCPNRDYACNLCGEEGTYAHITQLHDKVCDKKVLPCGKCFQTMQRCKINKHAQMECKYTMIPCKYKRLGCKKELKREEMKKHIAESDHLHLRMAIDAIEKKTGELMTFKVTGYQEKKENNTRFVSPSFFTSSQGYHMNIRVDVSGRGRGKGTHLSVSACLLEGVHDDKLSWPFVGDVTITLLNQRADDNHFSRKITIRSIDDTHPGKCWGNAKFIVNSELKFDSKYNTQYLKDDTLYFRVSVDVHSHKPWLECTAE